MSNIDQSLQELMQVDGAMGTCIVDYMSGMVLGMAGGGVDLELAAAGNSQSGQSQNGDDGIIRYQR